MKFKKGIPSKKSSLLMDFFIEEIRSIFWAEEHLIKAYPMMMEKSTSKALLKAFGKHLKETEWHADRIIRIFNKTGKPVSTKRCDAMAGIIKEENSIIEDTKEDTLTRDAALIMAAQKAEHYEIATYSGLVRLAKTLNLSEVAELLNETLDEEITADKTLSEIAERQINIAASGEEA